MEGKRIQVRIDEIVEISGEGVGRTLKTIDGHILASSVEVVFTEPEPIPYAYAGETRTIQMPWPASDMHSLPA